MNIKIASKNFQVSKRLYREIIKKAEKVFLLTPWKDSDYPILDMIIRKKRKKSLSHTEKKLISEYEVNPPAGGHRAIDNPVYYDGTIKLITPKKPLVTSLLGKTLEEAIEKGFRHLIREISKYKGMHFRSHSEFFDHSSIRGI